VYLVIPRNLGKIVKSVLPNLSHCFIQVRRKICQCICRCTSIVEKNGPMGLSLSPIYEINRSMGLSLSAKRREI
jgi:hypothetical protein